MSVAPIQRASPQVFQILDRLQLLPSVLLQIILEYRLFQTWEDTPYESWKFNSSSIIGYQQRLYVCDMKHGVSICDLNGTLIQTFNIKRPSAIDIEEKKIYIADESNITILNLNFETLTSWSLPKMNTKFRGLKVNDNYLYLTVFMLHHIFVYDRRDGKLLKTIGSGKAQKEEGQWDRPMGLTADSKYLYVCDNGNNRIQILTKFEGQHKTQWNKDFDYPISVINDQDIFYIGDNSKIQLFTSKGFCIQQLGTHTDYRLFYGICCLNDRLYVSDFTMNQIQAFKRTQIFLDIHVNSALNGNDRGKKTGVIIDASNLFE